MQGLPNGVVTFLFTDVEGSTQIWEEAPDSMMDALRQHDREIDESVAAHDGISVKSRGEGDSRFVVFRSAVDAVGASAEMQRRLAAVDWATPRPLRIRASLHSGVADLQLGDYYGAAVNRAARLRAIAHGGQTILSGSTWELVQDQLPDGVTITDMGQHRLKDLTRPEHVYQLNVDGLDNTFPPLVSLDAVPNNLPEQLTDFIGRQSELAETKRLLSETRLLTILAPGGAGKTRLAIQAAADVTANYPDGVFFIGLADIDSSADIIQTVAESLGLGFSSGEDPQIQLLAYLANRRLLFVFDNFEHLSDGVPIISAILKAAPQVNVVATSRSKLNVTGENVLTLAGLETTWDTPEEALQTSGARLFLDAANRSHPGLVLEPRHLDSLADILRLTGGMPLGILLAAAWADMLNISEIASEIAKSMDFLETDMGDVPDRHRSVRAVFDYSWKLLAPEERSIFAALSVFRGGFTREAAEAVAGASLRGLANLANKSLLAPSLDTGRYAVHELLRQYAASELEKDPDRCHRVLEAHAAYYSGLTEDAFTLLTRSDEPLMLATIERDLDNIRLAWRRYLSLANSAGARRMIGGLWFVYEVRGWYPGAVALFKEALDALDEHSDDQPTAVARAYSAAVHAFFVSLLGQPETGTAAAAKAADALRAFDDLEALWSALQAQAMGLLYLAGFEEHNAVMDEGIALGETLDSPFWAAGLKVRRSFGALATGDLSTAKRLLAESMEVLTQLDEHYYMSWNLGHQARIATREGRLQDAIGLFGRSADRARELGYPRGVQASMTGLAEANIAAGDLRAAETAFIGSLVAAERVSMVREMLGLMTKIARIRADLGYKQEAVELLATVLAEPTSVQRVFTDNATISEMARAALTELQKELDPNEYSAAHARGTSRPYDVAAKELIDSLDTPLSAPVS